MYMPKKWTWSLVGITPASGPNRRRRYGWRTWLPPRRAAAELHAARFQLTHEPVHQVLIGLAQDQGEGVIAAAFECKNRSDILGVEIVQEKTQILGAGTIVSSRRGSCDRPITALISVLRTL